MNNNFHSEEKKDEDEKASVHRQVRPARPGAVSVGKEEASRFDERIAVKRASSESSIIKYDDHDEVALPEPYQARVRPGAVSVGREEAKRFDARINVKRTSSESSIIKYDDEDADADKHLAGSNQAHGARPGAVAVGKAEASRFDERIAVKRAFSKSSPINYSDVDAEMNRSMQIFSSDDDYDSGLNRKPSARRLGAGHRNSGRRFEQDAQSQRQVPGPSGNNDALHGRASLGRLVDTTAVAMYDQMNDQIFHEDVNGTLASDVNLQSALDSLEDRIAAKVRREGGATRLQTAPLKRSTREEKCDDKFKDEKYAQDSPVKVVGAMAVNGGAVLPKKCQASVSTGTPIGSFAVKGGLMRIWDSEIPEKAPEKVPGKGASQGIELDVNEGLGAMHGVHQHYSEEGFLDESDLEYGIQDAPDNGEGLTVAFPVEEEGENSFIPSAVEYDPDAKPPIYTTRRFRLYATLCFFVLLAMSIAIGTSISLAKDEVDDASAKARYRESLGIREQVERLVGGDRLEEPTSPYSKALEWITHIDPMELTPENTNFAQRYVMAYFYYATSEKQLWDSCNPPKKGENSTCIFGKLTATSPTIKRIPVVGKIRWLSEEEECLWLGVFCDEFNQVRAIDLNAVNMTGTFPDGIQYLPFLQSFSLAYGQLAGTIPKELSTMKHLVNMEAHFNSLTGSIPDELWSSRSLQRVNLASNLLSGSIGSSISNLRDLKGLYLFDNLITGKVPEQIGELASLSFIRFHRNLFNGTIPSTLGNIKTLGTAWLHGNDLSGTIPSELGKQVSLIDIRLHNNERLTGSIPEELYSPDMYRLDLFNCNLTGTLSDKLGDMEGLGIFRVQNNNIHGQLPRNMGRLSSLSIFSVQGNNIHGSVPQELCELHGKSEFLKSVEADCLEPEEGGEPELLCEEGCCTVCCSATGETCVDTTGD